MASPYFKELFVDNPSPNPVIMLRETFSEELESILHFIYNGQVQVAEESLDDFLNTAKFLQVRLFFRILGLLVHVQVHIHVHVVKKNDSVVVVSF